METIKTMENDRNKVMGNGIKAREGRVLAVSTVSTVSKSLRNRHGCVESWLSWVSQECQIKAHTVQ